MTVPVLSRNAQYRARPTVRLDERPNERVSALINTFRVTEREGGLSSLELGLSAVATPVGGGNDDLALEDERNLRIGTRIKLYAGDEEQPREIFRGTVSGLEAEFADGGAKEMLVLAEDALQPARMSRRTKVHDRATIAQLARDLASQLSLTPRITGLDDDLGTQVQLNESDLAFLRRLLVRYDADLQVVNAELHVSARKDVARGALELPFGSHVLRARFAVDLADQVTEVTTSGWDPAQGTRVAGSSRGANLGPGRGRTGAQLLRDALGERKEHVGFPAVVNDAEASALADAAFDQRARRFVRVEATADGCSLIRVGTNVRLTGISPRFDNTYYVTSACHRYDRQQQYQTDFEAECAYLGNP